MAELNIIKITTGGKRAMLLKGPSGVGKTFQFRKLHEAGLKGLVADVEAKPATIEDLDPDVFLLRALDVPTTPMEKQHMLADGSSDFMRLVEYLRSDDHDYDFVYFDSLMRYADVLVDYLKDVRGLTGFDLWGALGKKMKIALRMLVGLTSVEFPKPVHVIATWGVEISTDWRGRRFEQPVIQGKMVTPWIDYMFDDVIRLAKEENAETGDVRFIAYTGGTGEFDAKVSSGAISLPQKIEDPSIARIIEVLQSGKQ